MYITQKNSSSIEDGTMNKRKVTILYILLILLLLFIWGNSTLPRPQSAAASKAVGKFLKSFLELFVGEGNVTDHLVRKLAHFCEFGALGVVLGLIVLASNRATLFHASYIGFSGVVVAVLDETIQLFSEGRGAMVQDVLLDTTGLVTGILGIILLHRLRARLLKKRPKP